MTSAEFHLPEADLAHRVRPEDRGTRRGTLAYQATRVAQALTDHSPEQLRAEFPDWPVSYTTQAEQFRNSGGAALGIGALTEVTRHNGARSLWLAAGWDWELIERRSAEGRLQRTRRAPEVEPEPVVCAPHSQDETAHRQEVEADR
jgi:hypothetical protein